MWTTWHKPLTLRQEPGCRVRCANNAFSGESAVPAAGRLACCAFLIESLPAGCDLNSLEAFIDGVPGVVCYVGPEVNRLSQVNVFLPAEVRTGLVPVRLEWRGSRLCPDSVIRVIPPGPEVPHLVSVSDGVNLLAYDRVTSGSMKATIEEVDHIGEFAALVDGSPVGKIESFQTDPLAQRYEVNFELPRGAKSGGHVLEIRLGKRTLTKMGIEVIR